MYEQLNYRGDVTAAAKPGQLLGHDEVYRPWAIIDAEYDPETKIGRAHV